MRMTMKMMRTKLQKKKRKMSKMMKTRKMKKRKLKKPKLPRDTEEAGKEATEADTEINEEDTTGDPITKDLRTETTTTVDIKSTQGMDITDTEVDTATEDTMVITVPQEAAD